MTPGQGIFLEALGATTWVIPAQYVAPTQTTRFVYDGDGGRVKQVTASGTTTFLGQSYEKDPAGKVTKYVFAGSQRIASLTFHPRPSTFDLHFYHGDHLGSSNLITDATGAVVEFAEYTPYGSLSRREGTANVPQKFTGQRLDASTGLYFYNARYYDPQLGRFISADPTVQRSGDPQDLNRYAYARNNPVRYVDPSGLGWFSFFKKFAGIAITAAVTALTFGVGAPLAVAIGLGSFVGTTSGALLNGVPAGKAFALGAVAGITSGFGAQFALGAGGFGGAAIGAAFGAAGGAASAAILGGDPGRGALAGGAAGAIGGGVGGTLGQSALSPAMKAAIGIGGAAAAGAAGVGIAGGDPLSGAAMGAAGAALSVGVYGAVRFAQSSPTMRQLLDPIGKVWASPYTALGMALGAAGLPFGAHPSLGNNAIQFTNNPLMNFTWAKAITFGNTINYRPGFVPANEVPTYDGGGWVILGTHEAAHTYQYQAYGPLFVPAYLAAEALPGINPFETAADQTALQ